MTMKKIDNFKQTVFFHQKLPGERDTIAIAV